MTRCKLIVPVVTPFKNKEVDEQGIKNIVSRISPYTDCIFCLGTTGEFQYLDLNEKKYVIKIYKEAIDKEMKKPLIVGVSCKDFDDTMDLVEFSENYADAIVMMPYFSNKTCILDSHLPIIIYNNPKITRKNLKEDDFESMMESPCVRGMKDSSGDFKRFEKYLSIAKKYEKEIFQGCENLIADSLRIGAQGFVPSMANAFPELFARLRDSYLNGNYEDMYMHQNEICILEDIYFRATVPILKQILALDGVCSEETRVRTIDRELIKDKAKDMIRSFHDFRAAWPY